MSLYSDLQIIFPETDIGIDDTTVQLKLSFNYDGFYTATSVNAEDEKMYVMQYGDLSWSYNLDDPILVPGTQDIIIHDQKGYLTDIFFEETATEYFDKRGKVQLLLNGTVEFEGTIIEDSISYNVAEKLIQFSVANSLDILNRTGLYYEDESGGSLTWQSYDPLGYGSGGSKDVYLIIWDIFAEIDTWGSFSFDDATKYAAFRQAEVTITGISKSGTTLTISTGATGVLADGDKVFFGSVGGITDLNHRVFIVSNVVSNTSFDVTLDTSQTYTSGGKWAAIEESTFTDLHGYTDNLFYNHDYGMTSLGDVLRALANEFFCFTGIGTSYKPFFRKLFTYDSSNTQTLGTVLEWEKNYKSHLYDYVEVRSTDDNLIYKAGTDTGIEDNKLQMTDTLFAFFKEFTQDPDVSLYTVTTASSNMRLNGATGNYVYLINEPALGETYHESGRIQADFWYKYRGTITYSRIDKFKVVGVEYDFVKNFVYDGKRYQIIGLTKKLEEGISEIEAIYLGLDS